MNSSLTATLTAASKEAQSVLGESFTLGGETYKGVVDEDPNMLIPTPNGYQSVRGLRIVATLSQFATPPSAATRPKIGARDTTWNLTSVRPGPLQYTLTCVIA